MSLSQIDPAKRAGSLRPIATLAVEPEEFQSRFGISFEEVSTNLGEGLAALLQTGSGEQFMLLRHLTSPEPGTAVMADENSPDPSADLRTFLDELPLEASVTWALSEQQAPLGSS